jgi:transcriptional regulator with XRE-family HTH domain
MEEYDDKTMPFYEEALLNNRTLFKIYKEGRITKEQVAEVLGISIQYVEWLEKKVYGLGILPFSDQDPKIE